MENNNKGKLVLLVILAISIISISIGFAVFSATLTIKESSGTISPNDNFSTNVKFKQNSLSCNTITGTASVKNTGVLNSELTEWSGLSVLLKEPGDSVTCNVSVSNTSTFDAFLKEIAFSDNLQCSGIDGATISTTNNDAICGANGVKATVSDGTNSLSITGVSEQKKLNISTNNIIEASKTKNISFTVEYVANNIDEDVIVTIPQLSLIYKSSNE